MQVQELLETEIPVCRCHLRVVTKVFAGLFSKLSRGKLLLNRLIHAEGELTLDPFMNVLVVLEDDVVIELGVFQMFLNPLVLECIIPLTQLGSPSF